MTLNQIGTISEEYGLIPTGMKKRGKITEGESPFKVMPKEEVDFLDIPIANEEIKLAYT